MNLFFYGVGILFCIGKLSVYAAGDVQLRHALAELEKDDLMYAVRTLSVDPCDDSLSPIWIVQQSIEEAHVRNDFECIDALYTYFKRETILESRWQSVSCDIINATTPPSPLWQNWYSRWIKWENQSSFKEALLSALFFPQRHFLESDVYGKWDGNQAVMYSLAVSAYYNNPQAKLYHAQNAEKNLGVEKLKMRLYTKHVMKSEIMTSATEMGRELFAIAQRFGVPYGIVTDQSASRDALELLKERSVTALLEFISDSEDENEIEEGYLAAGDRGIRSAYLTLARMIDDQGKCLELYNRVPGLGYILKWKATRNVKDFEACISYYVDLGHKGNTSGYVKAVSLALELGVENIRPSEATNWLLLALEDDMPLAGGQLHDFTMGRYNTMLTPLERADLKKKSRNAEKRRDNKTRNVKEKIESLHLF